MMERMHTRIGIADITLTTNPNPLNKTSEQTAISSTTCGYLNQQELNPQTSEINQHYQHITTNQQQHQQQQQQQQEQQQRLQQRLQHSTVPESIDSLSVAATTTAAQTPTPIQPTAAHNQPLHQHTHSHSHTQQPQHLIQSHPHQSGNNSSLGKASFSSLLQHTFDNSKHDNHLQHHLSEEHLHTHHLPNQSVYNHLHHHAQSHYTLNHLNHNHRSVAADCLTAAAIAANSPVTSPSALSISSTTSGCVSVTPSSAMAVAAAAHLHHNSQTSPMTNLHQNMGSLMNSGNSAR